MTTRTALYRHYNVMGELLYVGISLSSINRLYEHKKSVWYASITKVDIEHFETRMDALNAETLAIKNEKPLFNIYKGTNEVILHKLEKSSNNDFYQLIKTKKGARKCSYYSVWLYELLVRYKRIKTLTITAEQLRDRLEITTPGYASFGNIKQKIIDPAIKEINNYSDIDADYELTRKGNKIVTVKFTYNFKPGMEPKKAAIKQVKQTVVKQLREALK